MSIPDREIKLAHIEMYMEQCKLYANYWVAMATTGIATRRYMSKAANGKPPYEYRQLTDEEKTAEALDTALSHIDSYRESVDKRLALLRNDRESYNRLE